MRRLYPATFCFVLLWCGLLLAGCGAKMSKVEFPDAQPPTTAATPPPVSSEIRDRRVISSETMPEASYKDQLFSRIFFLSAAGRIENRLAVYGKKLSEWYALDEQMTAMDLDEERPQGWHSCLLQLEQVVEGYSRLQDFVKADGMEGNQSHAGGDLTGYWLDIDYLESGCEEVFKTASVGIAGWVKQFSDTAVGQMEAMVRYYVDNNMPNEAMQAYFDLVTVYPDHFVDIKTSEAYIRALLRTDQTETAVRALQEIIKGSIDGAEVVPLKRLLADLLLATGQIDEAKKQYQGLADFFASFKKDDLWVTDQLAMLKNVDAYGQEMAAFMTVLQAYISFDGKHVPDALRRGVMQLEIDFPTGVLAGRARHILWQIEEEAGAWVGRRLIEVDRASIGK